MVEFVSAYPYLTGLILFVLLMGAILTGALVLSMLSRQLDKTIAESKDTTK